MAILRGEFRHFFTDADRRSDPSIDFVANVAAALDVDPEMIKRYRKPRSPAT